MNPEDPRRLLAELEAARLAMRARPAPSRRKGIVIALAILLALAGLSLWLLAMTADKIKPARPQGAMMELPVFAKNSFATCGGRS